MVATPAIRAAKALTKIVMANAPFRGWGSIVADSIRPITTHTSLCVERRADQPTKLGRL